MSVRYCGQEGRIKVVTVKERKCLRNYSQKRGVERKKKKVRHITCLKGRKSYEKILIITVADGGKAERKRRENTNCNVQRCIVRKTYGEG